MSDENIKLKDENIKLKDENIELKDEVQKVSLFICISTMYFLLHAFILRLRYGIIIIITSRCGKQNVCPFRV